MADLTYVATWSGWVYVAFVMTSTPDGSSAGAARPHSAPTLPLTPSSKDCGNAPGTGTRCAAWCITATAACRQYLSIRYTDRLEAAGALRSVDSKGDSYDCEHPVVAAAVV